MGSTVTTRRVAAAVRTCAGPTLFVLFEESYSSNVRPHTPEWDCVGLGYLPAVLERIFRHASGCEGGMLRNRSGRLTPEGYIGTWLKELANPLVMRHTPVRLDVGDGCYSSLTATTLPAAVELLMEAGRDALAAELREKQAVTLDLARDAAAVLALQAGLELSSWRLVSRHAVPHRYEERDQALGYDPAPGRTYSLTLPTALKLNEHARLLQAPDGTWHCGGQQYAIVADHVQHLWQTELACPGHHRKRIAAFRNALENAPPAPSGLVVEIDPTKTGDDYDPRRIEKLRKQANAADCMDAVFRVLVTKETEYALTWLPRDCARWLLPDHQQVRAEQSELTL